MFQIKRHRQIPTRPGSHPASRPRIPRGAPRAISRSRRNSPRRNHPNVPPRARVHPLFMRPLPRVHSLQARTDPDGTGPQTDSPAATRSDANPTHDPGPEHGKRIAGVLARKRQRAFTLFEIRPTRKRVFYTSARNASGFRSTRISQFNRVLNRRTQLNYVEFDVRHF